MITDQELEKFNDDLRDFNLNVNFNYFDGIRNSCYADKKNHVTINYDGNIFKCTVRDFTSENSEGVIDDEGELIWNDKFYVRRNIKFSNAPCLECNILPICNGSCSQHYIENIGKGFCIYDFDESKKNKSSKANLFRRNK